MFHSACTGEAGHHQITDPTTFIPKAGTSGGDEGCYPPTLHRSILPDPPVAMYLPSGETAMSEMLT